MNRVDFHVNYSVVLKQAYISYIPCSMDDKRCSAFKTGFLSEYLIKGKKVYFIGIKGTGMCALAELMQKHGSNVSGSDTGEVFYTDDILKELNIPFFESFDPSHIKSGDPDLVIYSAAYSRETNAEIAETLKRGIPILSYPEALGAYSQLFDSTGIAGVHGKTTTTALAGTLLRGASVPAQVLAGSAVNSFGNRSTMQIGEKYFAAETCEYRKHFLFFHPQRIILTSVEKDHLDYFPTYKSIRDAFLEFVRLLPPGGELIYCADDPGAVEVAMALKDERPEAILLPYGFNAQGDFRIESYMIKNERIVMKLSGFPGELAIRIPGKHTARNAAAALALCSLLVKKEFASGSGDGWTEERREGVRRALEEFSGSKRRSEILGEAGGILFMDDYGHHPTAIKTTLEGIKEFYPGRRIVLSFMSHTFTRTAMLIDEFAASFENTDILLLHKIYSSAREVYNGGVSGRTLFEKTLEKFPDRKDRIIYSEEVDDGYYPIKAILKSGDLFITMGAGENWRLGKSLFNFYSKEG